MMFVLLVANSFSINIDSFSTINILVLLDRAQLQLGSLSHYINVRATGYQSLPHFPEEPPSGQVRDVEPIDGKTEMSTPLANV